MFLDTGTSFIFGEGFREPSNRTSRKVPGLDGEMVNPVSKRHQQRLAFAAFHKKLNDKYRKPCPTCSNLVKPELLGQHYDAYHPNIPNPTV